MMKSLTLGWIWVFMAFGVGLAGAQGVRADVDAVGSSDLMRIVVAPDEGDVADWMAISSPELYAYPVELDIEITEEPVELSFDDAHRVSLLINYTEDLAGRALVGRSPNGNALWKRSLKAGETRMIVEVDPQVTLQLVGADSEKSIAITRAYIEPKPAYTTRDFGFGESDDCHPNAVCEENEMWSDMTRSAVRIRMVLEEGIGWCSGTLMNNTARDGAPYILSAEHCLAQYTPLFDMWRFDFNYQSDDCDNPGQEPDYQSLTGCELLAKHRDTDFMLLELNDDVPVAYNAFFSGWNRDAEAIFDRIALIHHPSGDIKKVSRDRHEVSMWDKAIEWNEGYTTPANTHLRSRLDDGAFEGGSSGGGVYDAQGYLVGQLHGGSGDCFSNTAYVGAFSTSWDYRLDNNLKDWLDPLDSGFVAFKGMEHPEIGNIYEVEGLVATSSGDPVRGVTLNITGAVELEFELDSTGVIDISQLSRSDSIVITPKKVSFPENGVSVTDLLLIKQHLLNNIPFDTEEKIIAADATGNGEVTASDIVILQKLLLGLVQVLPSQDSWVFDPPRIVIDQPEADTVSVNFKAIKVGDVNGSADPGK